MSEYQVLNSKLIEVIGDYGIVRTVDRNRHDWDLQGNYLYGHKHVWYEVCLEKGQGDMIDAFKTLAEARKFIKFWIQRENL